MIPLLTYPLALLASLAIPTLVAIYFFRNRFKRHSVAGLFLWEHAMRAREGGTVIKRMRTSWLFILELLALLALILAATDPRLPFHNAKRSLVVILDDSASMVAGERGKQPRDRAVPFIRSKIRSGHFSSVRFMLAGQNPSLMDIVQDGHWQNSELLNQWKCQSISSDIDSAIAMASELTSGQSQLLIISDHAQSAPTAQTPAEAESRLDQIEWHAFGTPVDNIGFINVRRSFNSGKDRLFVAVGNYSPNNVAITIPIAVDRSIIKTIRLEIAAGGTKSEITTLPADCGRITMQLPKDALSIDNTITLLPEEPRKIGVKIEISDESLRQDIESAVAATGLRESLSRTHLTITDSPLASTTYGAWQLQFIKPGKSKSYVGPFVVDYNHPLAYGLDFDGVVWGASSTNNSLGNPIILAGNIPLLSEQVRSSGTRIFSLQLDPKLSNIQSTPVWPSLIWNITKWRSDALPGTRRANIPIGSSMNLALPDQLNEFTITYPDGSQDTVSPKEKETTITTRQPGLYSIKGRDFSANLASNFMEPSESDLRKCKTGSWGKWHNRETLLRDYRSWAWVAALIALLLLALHTVLTAKQRSNGAEI